MIANNLQKLRKSLNYGQKEFAVKLGINSLTYANYERGERKPPYELLVKLSEDLNIDLNWLIVGNGEMFKNENKHSLKQKNDTLITKKVSRIGHRLSEIQIKNDLLDKDIAKILGMYQDDYIDLKLGEKEPTFKILNKIKQSFDVSIDWLLYGD